VVLSVASVGVVTGSEAIRELTRTGATAGSCIGNGGFAHAASRDKKSAAIAAPFGGAAASGGSRSSAQPRRRRAAKPSAAMPARNSDIAAGSGTLETLTLSSNAPTSPGRPSRKLSVRVSPVAVVVTL